MRIEQLIPGDRADPDLIGAILTGDLHVAGESWVKGRRLSATDLATLAGISTLLTADRMRR